MDGSTSVTTVEMLTEFANSGKWSVDYPQHEIPKRRLDVLLDHLIIAGGLVAYVAWDYFE